MLEGSCLCGGVAYEVSTPLTNLSHCHCSMCRKVHGAMFATYARSNKVVWRHGQELVVHYESSKDFFRCFCGDCGSVVPEKAKDEKGAESYYFVPLGGIDQDIDEPIEKHIFVDSKAPWYPITDQLPQKDSYNNPASGDAFAVAESTEGKSFGGSCLCGDVAFACEPGSAKLMMLCHCTRCRKVKGAAHAANVFVAPEHFQWLRGQDKTTVYDLPGAERFGNSFCNRCGSSVPRKSEKSPMINIPAGVLDDTPGIAPKAHIFVGSMSNWFEITDDIPQHQEMP